MSETMRVFVNGRGVDVPRDARAVDAVRLADAALADEILGGARAITDSRGLPIPADSPAFPGAIYRTVAARRPGEAEGRA